MSEPSVQNVGVPTVKRLIELFVQLVGVPTVTTWSTDQIVGVPTVVTLASKHSLGNKSDSLISLTHTAFH